MIDSWGSAGKLISAPLCLSQGFCAGSQRTNFWDDLFTWLESWSRLLFCLAELRLGNALFPTAASPGLSQSMVVGFQGLTTADKEPSRICAISCDIAWKLIQSCLLNSSHSAWRDLRERNRNSSAWGDCQKRNPMPLIYTLAWNCAMA